MKVANQDIRDRARIKDVRIWEIALRFGYKHAEQFSRKLRIEFSPEDKARAITYIDEIAAEHEGGR